MGKGGDRGTRRQGDKGRLSAPPPDAPIYRGGSRVVVLGKWANLQISKSATGVGARSPRPPGRRRRVPRMGEIHDKSKVQIPNPKVQEENDKWKGRQGESVGTSAGWPDLSGGSRAVVLGKWANLQVGNGRRGAESTTDGRNTRWGKGETGAGAKPKSQ
jgi:hypothetical protein